jgi:hypothetical protein
VVQKAGPDIRRLTEEPETEQRKPINHCRPSSVACAKSDKAMAVALIV